LDRQQRTSRTLQDEDKLEVMLLNDLSGSMSVKREQINGKRVNFFCEYKAFQEMAVSVLVEY
jgi:hypothetical protein